MKTYQITGHEKVDAIAQINFSGDITPRSWYKHICYKTSKGDVQKVDRLAIDILADIVYWYRPYEKRDEISGESLGWRKKFSESLLRRSPDAFAEALNATVRCVRESIRLLEHLGLIIVTLAPIKTEYGTLPNVMYIDINPEAIAAITYNVEHKDPETLEKSLLTKWVTSDDEMGNKQLRNEEQAATKSSTSDYEIVNLSIYRDFLENSHETTQTSVCVPEEKELTPQTHTSTAVAPLRETPRPHCLLDDKPESTHQTDRPSLGTNLPGSFDKTEQSNYQSHPIKRMEDKLRSPELPPWMIKHGPNGWHPEFVEHYRKYLSTTPRYAINLNRQATTQEAIRSLIALSSREDGRAIIQSHWTSFEESKQQKQQVVARVYEGTPAEIKPVRLMGRKYAS